MSEDTDIDLDVRAFLGEALDGEEPPHREFADGSIARGDAARRRNRVLGGAGGVALTVAAVAGTMTIAQGGGAAGAASGPSGPPFKLVSDVNPWDNKYDLIRNLPAVLDPLLPKGLTVQWTTDRAHMSMGFMVDGGFTLTGPTDIDGVAFETQRASASTPLPSTGCGEAPMKLPDGSLSNDVCKSTAVSKGTVTTHTLIGKTNGGSQCQAWYEYTPTDRSYSFRMDLGCRGGDAMQLSPAEFVDLVQQPDFAKVVALADFGKPPTAFGKQARVEMDAAISKKMGAILPAGYRQRLSTTNLFGIIDLVGPDGAVLAGVDWHVDPAGYSTAESCSGNPDSTGCVKRKVPGGTFYEGHADHVEIGDRTAYAFVPDGPNAQEIWVELNSPKNRHPLSVDQFLAIAKAPGVEQAIKDLNASLSK